MLAGRRLAPPNRPSQTWYSLPISLAGFLGFYPEQPIRSLSFPLDIGARPYNESVHPSGSVQETTDFSVEPPVRGFLHVPENSNGDGLVLTHGAGADCSSRLLTAVATVLAECGFRVLRCDLPFRQKRPHGPPFPESAARDREGLRQAIEVLRAETSGRIFLGGHSYGGRQSTILASEDRELVAGLLLLSYPLHPPRKPLQLRTAHFAELNTPSLFVHGSRDPFGSIEEMTGALKLIPAQTMLLEIAGGGHDLLPRKGETGVPDLLAGSFQKFFAGSRAL
jgi:uncharacterized protein